MKWDETKNKGLLIRDTVITSALVVLSLMSFALGFTEACFYSILLAIFFRLSRIAGL